MRKRLPPVLIAVLAPLLLLACGREEETTYTPEPVPAEDTTFVEVPAGTLVSSAGDTVRVEGFGICRFEVTNRLYAQLAERAGLELPPDPGFPGMDDYIHRFGDHPVVGVSPEEAELAAAAMGCRLPTLEEWEYAASLDLDDPPRGLDIYPWGILDPVDAQNPANHLYGDSWEDRDKDGYAWTAPVGSYPLTDLGLADMAGNVAEMVTTGDSLEYLVCGGAYTSVAEELRIGSHSTILGGDRARHIGFRLVR